MALKPSDYDKALMGRINTGTGLLGKEKTIAKKVQPNKSDKQPYTWERIRTNPVARGVGAVALGAGVLYGYKKALPVFKKIRDIQQFHLQNPTNANKALRNMLDVIPETWRERAVISEKRLAQYGKGVTPKRFAEVALTTGAAEGVKSYVGRKRHATDLIDQSQDPARKYIRTKLAEIPVGAIDDAALYLTKAIQMVEESKANEKKSVVNVKPAGIVKKELQNIEKRALSMQPVKTVGKAIAQVSKHPVNTAMHVKNVAQNVSERVAPGAWDYVHSMGAHPGAPPGTTELAIASQAVYHTARHVGKGVDLGIQKSKPFLSKARSEIGAMWAQAKEGPK